MPRPQRETFFVTCAPGIEPVLHAEAKELRLAKIERQVGGILFEGSLRDAWRANLHLRSAVRVLLRLARFQALDAESLYAGAREIDWRRFLTPTSTLLVSAQTKESKLDHSLFIEQRTKDAIVDQFSSLGGERPSVDKEAPDVLVHVHMSRDRCTISVDTSGSSLHKRGWRVFQGKAPLSETLAAAVVSLSDWDERSPLIDPFCGSGTLLIEAALKARGIPPGIFRKEFGFERFPGHDAAAWKSMREQASRTVKPARKLILRGVENDAEAVRGARLNVESAGLADQIEIELGDAAEFEYRRGWNGWIVTNPPYGERVGVEYRLKTLYREFGQRVRERCGGYRFALLSGNPVLSDELALLPKTRTPLLNGPIQCELLQLEIPR